MDVIFEKSMAEVQKPTPNPEKQKTPRLREHFRKVRVNFCLRPCDTSQETNANCSEKLVQVNSFIWGGFPPLNIYIYIYISDTSRHRALNALLNLVVPTSFGNLPVWFFSKFPNTTFSWDFPQFQESPRKTKPKKGPKRKFMNFAHFCEFWCFSLGKQARFTYRTFVPECPCEKFMN